MQKEDETYYMMGRFLLEEEQFDLAINAFSKAIESDPENSHSYNYRGIARGRKEEYEESILDFTKAIQIDKGYFGALSNRGLSYYKLGLFEKALQDYDKAIELNPGISIFYANRGLAHLYRNENFEAIADFNKAIELDPLDFETRDFREEAYSNLSESEKIIFDLANSVAITKKSNDSTIIKHDIAS